MAHEKEWPSAAETDRRISQFRSDFLTYHVNGESNPPAVWREDDSGKWCCATLGGDVTVDSLSKSDLSELFRLLGTARSEALLAEMAADLDEQRRKQAFSERIDELESRVEDEEAEAHLQASREPYDPFEGRSARFVQDGGSDEYGCPTGTWEPYDA